MDIVVDFKSYVVPVSEPIDYFFCWDDIISAIRTEIEEETRKRLRPIKTEYHRRNR